MLKENKMTNTAINKTKGFIDLHTHTMYSDGTDTPETLVRGAKLKGTDILAITDHDTLAGYEEVVMTANEWGLTIVPGIEVSTTRYHILGLGIDPYNARFNAFLKKIQEGQVKEAEIRIQRLQGFGIPITLEKVIHHFSKSRIGRYNVLMAMVLDKESRHVLEKMHPDLSAREIFNHYLSENGVVGKVNLPDKTKPEEAIQRIHDAQGKAILAHPFKEVKDIREIEYLISKGLDGIEYQPGYGDRNEYFFNYLQGHNKLQRKPFLHLTYGSDFHGPGFDRNLLGKGKGKIANIEELLEGTWFAEQIADTERVMYMVEAGVLV